MQVRLDVDQSAIPMYVLLRRWVQNDPRLYVPPKPVVSPVYYWTKHEEKETKPPKMLSDPRAHEVTPQRPCFHCSVPHGCSIRHTHGGNHESENKLKYSFFSTPRRQTTFCLSLSSSICLLQPRPTKIQVHMLKSLILAVSTSSKAASPCLTDAQNGMPIVQALLKTSKQHWRCTQTHCLEEPV